MFVLQCKRSVQLYWVVIVIIISTCVRTVSVFVAACEAVLLPSHQVTAEPAVARMHSNHWRHWSTAVGTVLDAGLSRLAPVWAWLKIINGVAVVRMSRPMSRPVSRTGRSYRCEWQLFICKRTANLLNNAIYRNTSLCVRKRIKARLRDWAKIIRPYLFWELSRCIRTLTEIKYRGPGRPLNITLDAVWVLEKTGTAFSLKKEQGIFYKIRVRPGLRGDAPVGA